MLNGADDVAIGVGDSFGDKSGGVPDFFHAGAGAGLEGEFNVGLFPVPVGNAANTAGGVVVIDIEDDLAIVVVDGLQVVVGRASGVDIQIGCFLTGRTGDRSQVALVVVFIKDHAAGRVDNMGDAAMIVAGEFDLLDNAAVPVLGDDAVVVQFKRSAVRSAHADAFFGMAVEQVGQAVFHRYGVDRVPGAVGGIEVGLLGPNYHISL